jgi:beta-galactosidase
VTAAGATAPDGRRLRVVHNWSWDAVRLPLPQPMRDVLTGTDYDAGEEISLTRWDVRIFIER